MIDPTFFLITSVVVSGLTIFYFLKSRHIERMARIEHGMEEPLRHTSSILRFGIFLTFLGIGFLMGNLLIDVLNLDSFNLPGFILLFGGIGLITAHYIDKRENGG